MGLYNLQWSIPTGAIHIGLTILLHYTHRVYIDHSACDSSPQRKAGGTLKSAFSVKVAAKIIQGTWHPGCTLFPRVLCTQQSRLEVNSVPAAFRMLLNKNGLSQGNG
jgi:hypothetical protein